MKAIIFLKLCVALAVFLVVGCSEDANRFREGPVELDKWKAINYRYPANKQEYARWELGVDGETVTQVVNGDPSIYLSDRNLARTSISGTWLVDTNDDDDFIGFVFAYKNPGRFYLFDWKSGAQSDGGCGKAEQGMCVKIVDAPYAGAQTGKLDLGKPFDGFDLWNTKGTEGKVRLLHHEPTEGWESKKPYRFKLDFSPDSFHITVKDGERVIFDKAFNDNIYKTGKFGFYNFSQGKVVYKGFKTTIIPGAPLSRVMIIIICVCAFVLFGVIIIIILIMRKKQTQASGA